MPSAQPSLFDPPSAPAPDLPEGFAYRPDFITPAEEADLAVRIAELPLKPFEFRGYLASRRVIYFGWRYDFTKGQVQAAEPMPDWLTPIRDRAAAFAGLPPDALQHVLINEYAPGAPIGWHRDRPQFEDVLGASLLAPAPFRFRRKRGAGWERRTLTVAPRSIYLLRGPARTDWEHSIPPAAALRYSITFRSLRG
jgi:alkylated DNA repair dioxygenase AlkB